MGFKVELKPQTRFMVDISGTFAQDTFTFVVPDEYDPISRYEGEMSEAEGQSREVVIGPAQALAVHEPIEKHHEQSG